MAGEIVGYKPFPVHLERFDMDVTIVRTDDARAYFPVRHVCRSLGVSVQSQLDVLQADERYADALRPFRIPTEGGMQEMACIRQREAAWWIGHINPKKVRPEMRTRIEEYQAALMAEADRLAFGDLSAVLRDGQIQPYQPIRGELFFGCPRCGVPLCFVVADSGVHLRVG